MYVAVKGGEKAIDNAHALLAHARRGDRNVPEISPRQVQEQLTLAADRVMAEGALYDPGLAALAVKQARGDLVEAAFLVRAYRTTLPRFGSSVAMDTSAMAIERRISATYKDLPGGQVLGPTFDYTHRLLDFLLEAGGAIPAPAEQGEGEREATPRVTDLLGGEDLIERSQTADDESPGDITREAMTFPMGRDRRLQALARGDEGFLLGLGYSTQRGFGRTHPFVGEIRYGEVLVEFVPEELGFAVPLGTVRLTECQMVNQFQGSRQQPPQFTRGYGLVFGQSERKAMAMSLVDRSLRASELGEETGAPAQDAEFVLSHCDNIRSTGFVEHLKLPHYVDFQAELELVRRMRAEHAQQFAAQSTETTAEDQDKREAAE